MYQPKDVLQKTERIYGIGSNTRKRRLLPIWYKNYPWLHFCCTSLKVYCNQCKLGSELNLRIPRAEPAFSTEGFCNWKKATKRFKDHEISHAHQLAVAAHISRCQVPVNIVNKDSTWSPKQHTSTTFCLALSRTSGSGNETTMLVVQI